MKKFEVELTIAQTYTTKVVVEGDFKDRNDPAIDKIAKRYADNMNHDHWDYKDTEFEVQNVKTVDPVPEGLSEYRTRLLSYGYALDKVNYFSDEEVESELQAIGYLK